MSETNHFLKDIAARIAVINRVLHDDMPSSDSASHDAISTLRQEFDTLRRNMQRIPRPVGVPATENESHITMRRRRPSRSLKKRSLKTRRVVLHPSDNPPFVTSRRKARKSGRK